MDELKPKSHHESVAVFRHGNASRRVMASSEADHPAINNALRNTTLPSD